jgi:hypothetical protein
MGTVTRKECRLLLPIAQALTLIHKSGNEPERPIYNAELVWKLNSVKALEEPLL